LSEKNPQPGCEERRTPANKIAAVKKKNSGFGLQMATKRRTL